MAAHIKCQCGGNLDAVKDSRPWDVPDVGSTVRRRRQCDTCGERSVTFEITEDFLERFRRKIAKDMTMKLLEGHL
jgi:transcriptional regulator NrdR family protein